MKWAKAVVSVVLLSLSANIIVLAQGAHYTRDPAIMSELMALYELDRSGVIERIANEQIAAELQVAIEALDLPAYSGSWFDSATQRLYVAISDNSNSAIAQIKALGAVPVLTNRSLDEMNRLAAEIGNSMAQDPEFADSYLGRRVNFRQGRIDIYVLAADAETARTRLQQTKESEIFNVIPFNGFPVLTNATVSIATFRALDGFACKAKWRRHSGPTSSHFNAAGGFVRSPLRACLSAPVDCVVVARCRLGYRLRANALPRTPRDKLNEAILTVALVARGTSAVVTERGTGHGSRSSGERGHVRSALRSLVGM